MKITQINTVLRTIQTIPLLFIFIPLLNSYFSKINLINGLRKTRITLIVLIGAIIFSNLYFLIFSMFIISRANPLSQVFVITEKIINLLAYWLLFYLFRHATKKK